MGASAAAGAGCSSERALVCADNVDGSAEGVRVP